MLWKTIVKAKSNMRGKAVSSPGDAPRAVARYSVKEGAKTQIHSHTGQPQNLKRGEKYEKRRTKKKICSGNAAFRA